MAKQDRFFFETDAKGVFIEMTRSHDLIRDITGTVEVNYDLLMEDIDRLKVLDFLYDNNMQMAVQHRGPNDVDTQLLESCLSLVYDWGKFDQKTQDKPPLRDEILDETEFTMVCDYFSGSYVSDLIQQLKSRYGVFRGRFMLMGYKTCLSMHVDNTPRLHIPIITNPDCFMVVDDTVCRLEAKRTYLVDTRLKHTAVNSSAKDRLHLVFCVANEIWD